MAEPEAIDGLPNVLATRVLGECLDATHKKTLRGVCRRWKELVDSEEFSFHTTFSISAVTLERIHSCLVSGDGTEGTEFAALRRRLERHRGRLLIESQILAVEDSLELLAYVRVLFSLLGCVKDVREFVFQDSSVATHANSFLTSLASGESATDVTFAGVFGKMPSELRQWVDQELEEQTAARRSASENLKKQRPIWNEKNDVVTFVVDGLARRFGAIVRQSRASLEKLSLRGKIVDAGMSRYSLPRTVLPNVNTVCGHAEMLAKLSCPRLECAHILRATSSAPLLKFLMDHRRSVKCLYINMHDIPSTLIDREICWLLKTSPYWVGHFKKKAPSKNLADLERRKLRIFDEIGNQDPQLTAVAADLWRGILFPKLDTFDFQATDRGLPLRLLHFLHAPCLQRFRMTKVGRCATELRGALLEGLENLIAFIYRSRKELQSLTVEAKHYDVVKLWETKHLRNLALPKLKEATISASFFVRFLSEKSSSPKLRCLVLSRAPPAEQTALRSTASQFFECLNKRGGIRQLVLPVIRGSFGQLLGVKHLKIGGSPWAESVSTFESLPKLETLAVGCSTSSDAVGRLVSVAPNLQKLSLPAGLTAVAEDGVGVEWKAVRVIEGRLSDQFADAVQAVGFRELSTCSADVRLLARESGAAGRVTPALSEPSEPVSPQKFDAEIGDEFEEFVSDWEPRSPTASDSGTIPRSGNPGEREKLCVHAKKVDESCV